MHHEQSFLNQSNQTLLMLEAPDKHNKAWKGLFSVYDTFFSWQVQDIMKPTNIFSKEKQSAIDKKHYIYTICNALLLPLPLQENSIIQLVWNKMSQTPPILTLW